MDAVTDPLDEPAAQALLEPDPDPVRRASLSPSRAGDFLTCPLLYRLRVIDRLPEPKSPAMVRGTLVHAVLEDLFDLDAPGRTLEQARTMVPAAWERVLASEPGAAELFSPEQAAEQAQWLAGCGDLLESYFSLEDPRWLEPEARELRVSQERQDGLVLRGIVDRLDVAPDGRIRVVDYKTGRSPGPRFEDKALFQMKFYALVIWRTRGVIPTLLQLLYLGDRQVLSYEPVEDDLLATERKLTAIWSAIESAMEAERFEPRPSALCRWCAHQALCPEFGGTPPPYPSQDATAATA